MLDNQEDMFVFRGPTEYERDGESKVIDYGGYKLVDIDDDLISVETSPLKMLADMIEISDEYLCLDGKTQVLNSGVDNRSLGITTRLIHDMQVAQNAMRIANILGGDIRDVLIARIAGLGHDLGHTPFGHDGEVALSSAVKGIIPNSYFSHSEYGGEIIGSLIDEAIEACFDETTQMGISAEEQAKVLQDAKEEVIVAVRNHSKYYQYQTGKETIGQKSVRLSDTLTFMVTDLSDLMRGEDANNPGQKILPVERVLEEINTIDGLTKQQKEEMQQLVEPLFEGGDALRDIHVKLIEEAFSKSRRILNPNETATIIDDIKFLYDIESKAGRIEKDDTAGNRIEAFKVLGEYYKYVSTLVSLDADEARQNKSFKNRVKSVLNIDSDDQALEKITSTLEKFENIDYSRQNINQLFSIDTQDLELIKVLTDDLVAIDESQSLRIISRNCAETIVNKELRDAPSILTLFTIHNKIQYGEILATRDSRSVLGNDSIRRDDGQETKIDTAIKKRFEIIYEMAKRTENSPNDHILEDGSFPNLAEYNGRIVPKFTYIENGQPKTDMALSYAIYAVQQMQNLDFCNDNIMHEIREDLGISPKEYENIEENSVNSKEEKKNIVHPTIDELIRFSKEINATTGPESVLSNGLSVYDKPIYDKKSLRELIFSRADIIKRELKGFAAKLSAFIISKKQKSSDKYDDLYNEFDNKE